MRRMEPAILRFEVDAPGSEELRYYLRHAGSLIAASDIESPQRAAVLKRARAWILAALAGIDDNLREIEPQAVPSPISDLDTEVHVAPDEILIPTLVRCRRPS